MGGSHLSAALCHRDGFRLSNIVSAHYPAQASRQTFLDLVFDLGEKALNGTSAVAGAELAFPGPFDYQSGVSHMEHKHPYLLNVDLRQPIATHFGFAPERVRFLNDADSYLLGEVGAGAAKGIARTVGITLGTGVGAAFAVNGQIVSSGPGVPPNGEMWNLPWKGGILEDAISTRALQSAWRQRTGKQLEVAEIAALAAQNKEAAEVFAHFGTQLGTALRTFLTEFAPQVIVLGGGIAHGADLFLPHTIAALATPSIEVRIAQLFDLAPLTGAAVAWFHAEALTK